MVLILLLRWCSAQTGSQVRLIKAHQTVKCSALSAAIARRWTEQPHRLKLMKAYPQRGTVVASSRRRHQKGS